MVAAAAVCVCYAIAAYRTSAHGCGNRGSGRGKESGILHGFGAIGVSIEGRAEATWGL